MTTVDLKKSVLDYIDNADDRLLRLIKALVETYQEDDSYYEITEGQREILDERLKSYRENPDDLLDWEEVKQNWCCIQAEIPKSQEKEERNRLKIR